ncbi:hypothetical protein HDU93_005318, partial [Gonapodya sp. JEL0774]
SPPRRSSSRNRKRSLSTDFSPGASVEPSASQRPFKASKMATTTLTLGCLLLGERNPFEVITTPLASVDSLKEAIKTKRSRALSQVDAADLDLWKINVSCSEIATLREE